MPSIRSPEVHRGKRIMNHCPHCNRQVGTRNRNRYAHHVIEAGTDDYCPMSGQRIPVTGTSEQDYANRAALLLDLAATLQDEDPLSVWQYTASLPAVEIQRLLQLALAAIDIDRKPSELFAWVYDLPASQEAS
jgi:hypothetical protein